jgi:aspartyl-tRNA(Asn)/glutamyl-tRNA(Gln) amidotransferase subunit A
MSDALHYQSITELSAALQARRISAVDLMQAVIARTQAVEDRVHAFNSYDVEDALAQARASDERRARGEARGRSC